MLHAHGLGDILREHGRSYPAQTAAVCGQTRLTYQELDGRVNRLANAMRASGFREGDRVLWLGQNCHRLLEGLLAAAKLGGIFCPANWRSSAEEVAYVLGDLEPRVVLWQQAELGRTIAEAKERSGSKALWWQHDGGYEATLAAQSDEDPRLEVDPERAVLLLYTAAFDGKPKGCLISHTALVVQSLVTSKLKDLSAETVYLNSGPLFHVAALLVTTGTFLWAGRNVFTPRADPEELCRLIETERCTGALLLPPTVEAMVQLNRGKRFDLKSLKSYAASPEWNEMVSRDESPSGRRPGGYGQTECLGHLTYGALGGRSTPLAQVRIVDAQDRDVPPGEVGQIVARGLTLMEGYWARPEDTARKTAGGWHHTGDLGRREKDGSIAFIGTMQRLIKSAAENIYPAEVEACIRSHPAVADCAVIGVPDATWGQNVKAIVALRPGQSAAPDELIEHCRARLASYKKPRSVELVDAIPKKSGGIDYAALDQRFGGGGYPGA